MNNRPSVLFETEGSYPYHGGGVSTWAHILCSELENDVDFTILTLTGNPFVESRYQLPSNIKDVIHVPMWGAEEPVQYYNGLTPFSEHIRRKSVTTDEAVKKLFFPMFRDFVDCILNNQPVTGSNSEDAWKAMDLVQRCYKDSGLPIYKKELN